jgi:hypothetical protein
MSASSSSASYSRGHRARRTPEDPIIHRRRVTAVVLTVIAVAFGIAIIATAGRDGALIYFLPFPVALALLWASTSSLRFDERRFDPDAIPEGTRIDTV